MTTEPMVQISMSLAETLMLQLVGKTAYRQEAALFRVAIAKAKRDAALADVAALTQGQYADTVNPLIRSDNG